MDPLKLEDMAFLAACLSSDIFDDSAFVHLYCQKPRWSSLHGLINEFLYIEEEYVNYSFQNRSVVKFVMSMTMAGRYQYFLRTFTMQEIDQLLDAYIEHRFTNP